MRTPLSISSVPPVAPRVASLAAGASVVACAAGSAAATAAASAVASAVALSLSAGAAPMTSAHLCWCCSLSFSPSLFPVGAEVLRLLLCAAPSPETQRWWGGLPLLLLLLPLSPALLGKTSLARVEPGASARVFLFSCAFCPAISRSQLQLLLSSSYVSAAVLSSFPWVRRSPRCLRDDCMQQCSGLEINIGASSSVSSCVSSLLPLGLLLLLLLFLPSPLCPFCRTSRDLSPSVQKQQ